MTDEEIDTIMEMQCPDDAMAGVVERLIAALRESRGEAARLRAEAVAWVPCGEETPALKCDFPSHSETVTVRMNAWYDFCRNQWETTGIITHWSELPGGPNEVAP